MKIRYKILSGFLIMVAMLIIAGAITIYEFSNLTKNVNAILDNNYQSIVSCKHMLEGLEREDSGILMLLLGKWEEGRGIIMEGDSIFQQNIKIVEANITEPGEEELIKEIRMEYEAFRKMWRHPIVGTNHEGNINWYFDEMHQEFKGIKTLVSNLMYLNQESMYKAASVMRSKAERAITPGIVAVVSGLVFSLLFNYFIDLYMVKPIVRITKALKTAKNSWDISKINVETNDEIKELAEAIDNFIIEKKHRS